MLKLERADRNIQITIREKEKHPSLLLAFSIALLLHLAALFLFRIKTAATGPEEIILAPSAVNATILAAAEIAQKEAVYPFEPRPPEPDFALLVYQEPPYPFPLELALPPKPPRPFSLTVGGQLAEMILLPYQLPESPIRARYAVRVENESGKVIWYEAERPDPLAEKIINELCFIGGSAGGVTMGWIELL